MKLLFMESSWSTPCLVLNGFIFNCHSRKNNREYWRCHNYSKRIHSQRCHIRCVIEDGKLKGISGGRHGHPPHTEKIEKMLEKTRALDFQGTATLVTDIKVSPRNRISGSISSQRNEVNRQGKMEKETPVSQLSQHCRNGSRLTKPKQTQIAQHRESNESTEKYNRLNIKNKLHKKSENRLL